MAVSKITSDISSPHNHKSTKLDQKQHVLGSSLQQLDDAVLHRHDKTTSIHSIG